MWTSASGGTVSGKWRKVKTKCSKISYFLEKSERRMVKKLKHNPAHNLTSCLTCDPGMGCVLCGKQVTDLLVGEPGRVQHHQVLRLSLQIHHLAHQLKLLHHLTTQRQSVNSVTSILRV